MTQRDMMRKLYCEHGGNREKVIRAYANAEDRGLVTRERDKRHLSSIDYAGRLFSDGERKQWVREMGR